MSANEILVTVEHEEDVAAVIREPDGSLSITGYLSHGPGTGIQGLMPAREGIPGGVVIGGALPTGATSAIVIDDTGTEQVAAVGGGAWLVVQEGPLFGPEAPVRFLDGQQQIVRRPLPESWARTPVPDAIEPCPACGEVAWDEVTPDDDSRGMQGTSDDDMQPSPILTCRFCGHEEPSGTFFGTTTSNDENAYETAERVRAAEEAMREKKLAAIRGVRFPVFAPLGDDPVLSSWGGWHQTTQVSVSVGGQFGDGASRVVVQTDSDPDEDDLAREIAASALTDLLFEDDGPWPDRSEAAMALWLRIRERSRHRAAALARRATVEISVAGEATSFALVGTDETWSAVGRKGELQLTISGRHIGYRDVELVEVRDLSSLVDA